MNRPHFLKGALLTGTILQRKLRCATACTVLLCVSVAAFVLCLTGIFGIGPIDLVTLGFAAAAAAALFSRFE